MFVGTVKRNFSSTRIDRHYSRIFYYISKWQLKQTKTAYFFAIFREILDFWRFFALEPFGLFHFLQSLLNTPAQNPPETESQPSATETPTEHSVDEKIEKENACAKFLENHDARARRIRK